MGEDRKADGARGWRLVQHSPGLVDVYRGDEWVGAHWAPVDSDGDAEASS